MIALSCGIKISAVSNNKNYVSYASITDDGVLERSFWLCHQTSVLRFVRLEYSLTCKVSVCMRDSRFGVDKHIASEFEIFVNALKCSILCVQSIF